MKNIDIEVEHRWRAWARLCLYGIDKKARRGFVGLFLFEQGGELSSFDFHSECELFQMYYFYIYHRRGNAYKAQCGIRPRPSNPGNMANYRKAINQNTRWVASPGCVQKHETFQ